MRQASFGTQLRYILNKNFRVKLRNRRSSVAEVVAPLYFIIIVVFMKVLIFKDVEWNMISFDSAALKESASSAPQAPDYLCLYNDGTHCGIVPPTWKPGGRLAYTPDSKDVEALVKAAGNLAFPNGTGPAVMGFSSEDEMSAYALNSTSPESIIAGFTFTESDVKTGVFKYTLRMATYAIPATSTGSGGEQSCRPKWASYSSSNETLANKYEAAEQSCDGNKYLQNFFLGLQWAMDQSIMTTIAGKPVTSTISVQAMPRPRYVSQLGVGGTSFLAMYIPLGLGFFVQYLLQFLVSEKEAGIREGMRMMGLKDSVFWISWFITYAIIEFGVALVATVIVTAVKITGDAPFIIVLCIIYFFLLATICLAFLVSVFFSKAKTAGGVGVYVGMIATLLFTPLAIGSLDLDPSRSLMLLASLLPGFACSLEISTIWNFLGGYNGRSASFTMADVTTQGPFNVSIADIWIMNVVSGVLFSFLAWYLENILPSSFGVRRHPLFIFQRQFWMSRGRSDMNRKTTAGYQMSDVSGSGGGSAGAGGMGSDDFSVTVNDGVAREVEDPARAKDIKLSIRGLRKVYQKNAYKAGPEDVTALQGLDLDIYEGEIFALLGHNGAGKSTAIGMLSGLFPPTSGDAEVYGMRISDSMEDIRSLMGVCPQQNLLFESLSVLEHMRIYAAIKGVPHENIEAACREMLVKVDLVGKADSFASKLSGGQKRKLGTGIALIGDPKVVYLDEPTTGMDPASRRRLWETLKEFRKDRIIILSTHFMDEADQLADRKAIISKGELKCVGSSLYLKNKFGLGYVLQATKLPDADIDAVTKLIQTHISDAVLTETRGEMISYRLPMDRLPVFPDLLTDLEKNLKTLRLRSYGVSVTTLEDVFMRFADDQDGASTDPFASAVPAADVTVPAPVAKGAGGGGAGSSSGLGNTAVSSYGTLADEIGTSALISGISHRNVASPSSFAQIAALAKAKGKISVRNPMTLYFSLFMPILFFILAGTMKVNIPPPSTSLLAFNSSAVTQTGKGVQLPFVASGSTSVSDIQKLLDGKAVGYTAVCWNEAAGATGKACDSREDFDEWLKDNADDIKWDVAVVFTKADIAIAEFDYTLVFNSPAPHAMPVGQAAIAQWLVQALGTSVDPKNEWVVSSASRPFAEEMVPFVFQTGLLFATLGLLFVPSNFCGDVVKDRKKETKHLMYVMGMRMHNYWLGCLVHDFIQFAVPGVALIIVLVAFKLEPMASNALPVFVCLLVEFMFAMIAFAYMLSFLFDEPDDVYKFVAMMLQLSSLIPSTIVQVLFIANVSESIVLGLHIAFSIVFPPYGLMGAMLWINKLYGNRLITGVDPSIGDYFSDQKVLINLLLYPICILLCGACVYWVDHRRYSSERPKHAGPSFLQSQLRDAGGEDDDVVEERQAAKSSNSLLCAQDLRKVYTDKARVGNQEVVAVSDVSLAIPTGVCFGLLGPNGAGKTTTISMMNGSVAPTNGDVSIDGFALSSDLGKAFERMGFCAQQDTLWDELTPREHLILFGSIKGMSSQESAAFADDMMKRMDLHQHGKKQAKKLSGGNKRKLCASISLTADPKVVFLDEPSSGMDVATRRFMWRVLQDKMASDTCSMVLTTHSMEEADFLCGRIGIIIKGRMRCVGTTQHLKSKFGSAYELVVRVPVDRVEELSGSIETLFPGSKLEETWVGRCTFSIPPQPSLTPAVMFRHLAEQKEQLGLTEYSLGQTTLEQVYLKIAREQDLLDDVNESEMVVKLQEGEAPVQGTLGRISSGGPTIAH